MSFRKALLAATMVVGPLALASVARAEAPQPHVRGTLTAVKSDEITVKTEDGQSKMIKLDDKTRFIGVTKSSLDAINKDTYIGTATKDVGSKLVALEVVVFPNAMRGAGEGHYDWDALPDTTLAGGGTVSSTMTNGTVTSSAAPAGKVNSTMTNGTVATTTASGGARELTVTYKGGEQHITVPPNVPIVMLQPGSKDELKTGGDVVVTTDKSGATALGIAIGLNGVKPPM